MTAWVTTTDGDLINLDHVVQMGVRELQEPTYQNSHGVVVETSTVLEDNETSAFLFLGTEEACKAFLARVATKLHRVP